MNCPQCHTPLETTTLAEGMELRRCPRCGWSDAGSGGQPAYTPTPASAPGEPAATGASRKTRIIILIVMVDVIITLAAVAFLLVFKKF